jgi:hypothetical protein
MQDGQNILTW